MPFVEDLSVYFTDFGVAATLDGQAVRGVFDNGYMQALGGMASAEPSFMLRSADASTATQASLLVVAGTTYRVRSLQPDGTGVTTLLLERQ